MRNGPELAFNLSAIAGIMFLFFSAIFFLFLKMAVKPQVMVMNGWGLWCLGAIFTWGPVLWFPEGYSDVKWLSVGLFMTFWPVVTMVACGISILLNLESVDEKNNTSN